MIRRDITQALFLSAAGAALVNKRAEAQTCTAPCYVRTAAEIAASVTPVNTSYAPGNVLRYGTNTTPGTTDMTSAFQSAFNQQAQTGGAPVYVPTGSYLITATIAISSSLPFTMYGDGMGKSVITKTGDSDAFDVTNTNSAYNQTAISDLTLTTTTTMTSGSGFKITYSVPIPLPTVTMRDVLIITLNGSGFAAGVQLNDCAEAEFTRVSIIGSTPTAGTGFVITASQTPTGAAGPIKWVGCSVYDVKCGAYASTTTDPGIEGLQFYGCDFVGVETGVIATSSSYAPPQLTWIGGHINASVQSFNLTNITQVLIQGLLSYSSGSSTEHIALTNVPAINITGNIFEQTGSGTAVHGVVIGVSAALNAGIIANNMFNLSASSNAVYLLEAANTNNLTILGNVRVGGAATVAAVGTMTSSTIVANNSP